jgi:spindle assembly abnormal protein 6
MYLTLVYESYLAVLNTSDEQGKSVFSIVETNPFKHLTHLSLHFFPGNDAAIKAYLAARLSQTTTEKRFLSNTLKKTQLDLQKTSERAIFLQKELDELSQKTQNSFSKAKMKFADDLNIQRENSLQILKQREEEYQKKMDSITEKYEMELKTLKQKISDQEENLGNCNKKIYQTDLKMDQYKTQIKELELLKINFEKEIQTLRQQNKQIDQKNFQQEKNLSQAELRIAALQQQVLDKEEVISKTSELLKASNQHQKEMDDSFKMYKENHLILQQKLELSITEIHKGNKIIENIQQENRNLKLKLRMKMKILKQQEDFLQEKQHQKDELVLDFRQLKEENKQKLEEIQKLKLKIQEYTQKLEESNKLLASNQQGKSYIIFI